MTKLYRDKVTGKKLYPVCNWHNNQHILYNALDRAYNHRSDLYEDKSATSEELDKAEEWIEEVERLLDVFNSHVVGSLVYATYEDGAKIKEIIAAHECRHDMLMAERRSHD